MLFESNHRCQFHCLRSSEAFTLSELVVVLGMVAVLVILLVPAFAATQDRGNRAVCQNNLRQIGMAITQYTGDNNGAVVQIKNGVVITLPGLSATTAQQIGLIDNFNNTNIVLNGSNIWACPDRPARLPYYESNSGSTQWVIGYQYYGGLTNWTTDTGPFYGHSPVKLSTSKPYWALASDTLLAIGSNAHPLWLGQYVNSPADAGDTRGQIVYGNCPPHLTADDTTATGGNEVFCDGSVQWITIENMHRFTYWSGAYGNIESYWYQDPQDFSSSLMSVLPALAAHPQ